MNIATFSVDASSILRQCEDEMESQGPAAIGLRFGCREIRRQLAAIGEIALRLQDDALTQRLIELCVLQPIDDVRVR